MTKVSASFERIEKLLADADKLFVPFASKAILECLEAVREIIQVYPPQPSRTRGKTFNTYVRGQGQYPKSAFILAKDAPGGFKAKKVKKSAIRFTSQQLDKRWKMRVASSATGADGVLSNDASYSGYVNGFEDGEVKQVGFHKTTGWKSSNDAIEEAMPEIEAIVGQSVEKFLAKFAN